MILEENKFISDAVQQYIYLSKRFYNNTNNNLPNTANRHSF